MRIRFSIEGVTDDGSDLIKPNFKGLLDTKEINVDWSNKEEDEIECITQHVLKLTEKWLQAKREQSSPKMIGVKSSILFSSPSISNMPKPSGNAGSSDK